MSQTLDGLAKAVEALHTEYLFGELTDEDLDAEAAQFFLLAIDALSQARRFASIAALKQARALGDSRLAVYR